LKCLPQEEESGSVVQGHQGMAFGAALMIFMCWHSHQVCVVDAFDAFAGTPQFVLLVDFKAQQLRTKSM
jgi:hypothetical protein